MFYDQMKNLGWNGLLVLLGLLAHGALAAEPGKTQHLHSIEAVPEGIAASDWTNIRAVYQAQRYQVAKVNDLYRAYNPEQRWRTDFDAHGFLTRPDIGGWKWGLELKSYGFPTNKRAIRSKPEVKGAGARVCYLRDAALREWFVNDSRGLEHGFTLEQAPDHAGAQRETEIEFDLAVRGDLRPAISPDGAALRFVDAQDETVLTYSELKVWDADGRNLPARFAVERNGVRLTFDADGARYPITVDPIAQQAYLKASNTDAGDRFGYSVAVSGDTVVVGAPGESSDATGIGGDQADNSVPEAGAAYVFVRNGVTWTQQAYLKASNTDAGDEFGYSVAVSGDTVVVGAYGEGSNATGINGDQTDNTAPQAGATYVFVRNGTTWTQQAYLKASNTDSNDRFGYSVAVSGDTAAVGAYLEASNATGINGNQANNSAPQAGATYVFVRNGTTWTQQAYLKASNTEAGDFFGYSVAVSGDTVVAGAFGEDSGATGINGDQTNNSASEAGAAYVFVRNGTTWTQQAYLKASNTDAFDLFGYSAAVSGDTVVVGAYGEGSDATGIDGNQTDNSAPQSGAAYVFVRNGVVWTQQAYLKASNTNGGDSFGYSVAVSGDTVVAGAFGEDSNSTGIDGDQTNNIAPQSGAAYVFLRNGGVTWTQQAYLKASNTDAGDFFGSVSVSGGTVIVGAYSEASNSTGINGNQADDHDPQAGAAYVFIGLGPAPTILGNISTRGLVETGDNVLIGGFIITGTQPKAVILRAIGPSLPVAGAMADPTLELHDGAGTLIASNDNWMDASNKQAIIDTTIPPTNNLESAILTSLLPGAYTAIVSGVNNSSGIALVEAYDLDQTVDSELANISTRGLVGTGDNVLIGGFIVLGVDAQKVIVRAIGPTLPVTGKLADPTLELYDSNGMLLAMDDNWQDDPVQEAEIIATGIPPTDPRESALVETLAPAAYTAIVRGKNDSTGIALVEVYALQSAAASGLEVR
jgi:hypothetical protein